MSTARPVVLASTSRYRGELLRRLLVDFEQRAPGVDESALDHEMPRARAARLALAKAKALVADTGPALIIGSDQVAELDGSILDKPGDETSARMQLSRCSGRSVTFHTAVCVMDAASGRHDTAIDTTRVHFRQLDADSIARYIAREQPLDCAGSFKCEGLGIALFERIENEDPSALIGLPLIACARLLRMHGLDVLAAD